MNFTMVSPFGNSSDYPFRFGMTADLGQTVYSNQTAYGLMVRLHCICLDVLLLSIVVDTAYINA